MKYLRKIKNFNLLAVAVIFLIVALPTMLAFNLNKEFAERNEKIGVIILGDIKVAGWNESQYKGIKAACDYFGIEKCSRHFGSVTVTRRDKKSD